MDFGVFLSYSKSILCFRCQILQPFVRILYFTALFLSNFVEKLQFLVKQVKEALSNETFAKNIRTCYNNRIIIKYIEGVRQNSVHFVWERHSLIGHMVNKQWCQLEIAIFYDRI